MKAVTSKTPSALFPLLALSAVTLAGCARVKPEELSVELAKVRQEMRAELEAGDRKVASDLGARVDGLDARLNTLATELDQLSDEFDVTVERMESAIRFNAPVFFEFADATVRDADRAVLDRFASVVRQYYPNAVITAEGFTDQAGSAAYNKKLGERRAQSVVDYLTAGGLDQAKLRAVSYGEVTDRLMEPERGPGETGRRNRRVVLVIEGEGAATTTTTTTTATAG